MREEHHQASLSNPLGLSRCDKLVNDALGCVVEVTKLSLPDNQGIGVGHGEAQLKAQHCILRERGVADCVGGLVWVQVGQSIVLGLVHLLVRARYSINLKKIALCYSSNKTPPLLHPGYK